MMYYWVKKENDVIVDKSYSIFRQLDDCWNDLKLKSLYELYYNNIDNGGYFKLISIPKERIIINETNTYEICQLKPKFEIGDMVQNKNGTINGIITSITDVNYMFNNNTYILDRTTDGFPIYEQDEWFKIN